jgi:hypothetical protein
MPTATPKKFAMQQVFEILLQKPSDNSLIAYLTDTKTSGLENTVEMVYPTGARGNVYIGGGFAHSRRATANVTMATWNTDVMAAQNGVDVEENVPSVTHYDVIQAGTGGALATTYKAIGLAGKEIGYIYKLADDGTAEKTFTQSSETTPSAGEFVYDATTKAITFYVDSETPANSETPIEGERYACVYDFKPAASSQITISGDAIPDVAIATFYGLARDICNGELYPAQIKGRVQINGNWSFDVSADGDPAVQDLSMEFVKGCLENDLYTFTVYTNDEYKE